jgi:hypothetical protein
MTDRLLIKERAAARPAIVVGRVPWPFDIRLTLRDLIRERVRLTLEAHHDHVAAQRDAPMADPDVAAVEAAMETALQGFAQNRFFVTVNGRQITELDEPIDIASTSDVVFVRLIPLAGG